MFEVVTRNLDQRREKVYLAATIALAVFYLASAVWFARHDVRSDLTFLAKREAIRVTHLPNHPLVCNHDEHLVTDGRLNPSIALLSGWSDPEPWGVWTAVPIAAMAFDLPQGHRLGAHLVLNLAVMLGTSGTQRLTIAAAPGKEWAFDFRTDRTTVSLDLPAAVIGKAGLVQLALRIADPRQVSDDPRLLGVGVKDIFLQCTEP